MSVIGCKWSRDHNLLDLISTAEHSGIDSRWLILQDKKYGHQKFRITIKSSVKTGLL